MPRQLVDSGLYRVRDLMSTHEAAAELGVSYRRLMQIIDENDLSVVVLGQRDYRLLRTDILSIKTARSAPKLSLDEALRLLNLDPTLPRADVLAALYTAGHSMGQIGEWYEISRSYVHQVLTARKKDRKALRPAAMENSLKDTIRSMGLETFSRADLAAALEQDNLDPFQSIVLDELTVSLDLAITFEEGLDGEPLILYHVRFI